MDKFDRNYILTVQTRDGRTIRITRPFTLEFDIHRNSLSSANTCSIRIYNLNPDSRNQIRKDQFDYGDLRQLVFAAGYGDKLSLAFSGNVTQAWSVREGTNFITQIECFDGGYAYVNAISNQSFPSGTTNSSIIDSLAKSLPGVSIGAVGSFPGELSRASAMTGSTIDRLTEITGGAFFIDNGKVNCLSDRECLEGDVPLINAQAGLLGTPVKEQTYVNFEMLFEPSLRVGQLIRLDSETAEHFNGTHKVLSIRHRGVISDAVSGNAVTNVGLLPGVFTPVAAAGS